MTWNTNLTDDEDLDVIGDEDDLLNDGAETPEQHEDDVRRGFQKDVEEALRLDQEKPKDRVARKKYIKDHHHTWARRMPDQGNFLHFLADQNHQKYCLQWVVAYSVSRLPKLMGDLDKDERTPLTVAIIRRNKSFVHAVCRNISLQNSSDIRDALKSECLSVNMDNPTTCLHAAVSGNLDTSYILDIIRLVPDDMFRIVDLKGRTALHIAVEYLKSSDDQIRIVKRLLRRDSAALRIRCSIGCENQISVYQYHEKTRKDFKARDPRGDTKSQMKPPPSAISDAGGRDDKQNNLAKKRELFKLDRPLKGANQEMPRRVSRVPSFALSPTSTDGMNALTSTNLEPRGAARSESSPTTSQPTPKFETANEEHEQSENKRKTSSDELLTLLKLEYLRNMNPLEALDHIQNQNSIEDKEFWFDFGPRPHGKVKTTDFKRQFDHLKFDEVLQYVAFPRLEVEYPIDESNVYDGYRNGREDMKFFFEWLKKKGVKRILRVEVDDMDTPFHSDETIEQALEGFCIEVLDWKRLDLDPGTVKKIGSDLRELQLYWGGGNNVLRSWSEKNEGLCMTKSLEKITLHQTVLLESKARTEHNLAIFRDRLEESWKEETASTAASVDLQPNRIPELVILPPDFRLGLYEQSGQSVGTFATTQHQKPHIDTHKWMDSMERFASSFRQIPELRKKQQDPSLDPVKIALIDDGVDFTHPDLRGLNNQNLPGKSFDFSYDERRISPHWRSASGHGTLMARLIRRICPSAIVYVIKVRTIRTISSSKVQIETDSTIKAIKHAINIGAHIISMSWTTKPPENSTEKDYFDRAISEAGSKPILMFCAASDQGLFEDFTYPHASNPALTFRIGAAKATGDAANFVGDSLDFVLPGQDVVLTKPYADPSYDRSFEAFASHTGSSVATALAAGLAAVVYECVRLGVIHTNNPQTKAHGPIPRTELTEICKKTRMKRCLESIGVNRQSGKPYLEVWNRFEKPGIEIDRLQDSRGEQLNIVSGLARLLLEMT